MQRKFKFYKTEENRWFIDLPEFIEQGGNIDALEMVCGADTFLDMLSFFTNEIILTISDVPFEECLLLNKKEFNSFSSGAEYTTNHPNFGLIELWLCDVSAYIFGFHPETIYYKK